MESIKITSLLQKFGSDNPRVIGRKISRVLHTIRASLSKNQSEKLLNRLPDYLKLIYVSNWPNDEKTIPIYSLEQFNQQVFINDRNSINPVFSSKEESKGIILNVVELIDPSTNFLEEGFLDDPVSKEISNRILQAA